MKMKIFSFKIIFLLIFITAFDFKKSDDIRICSWNIANFGTSKNEEELNRIVETMSAEEFVCIQEISTGISGASTLGKLVDKLDRTGANWDYVLSNPSSGEGSERYAFIWKSANIQILGDPWLESSLSNSINREPFLARFKKKNQTFLIATFHAVPKNKNPSIENSQLYSLDSIYEKDHLIICGDFNSSEKSEAFWQLKKRNIHSALKNQKTTIKMEPKDNEHLANPYDNIWYETDEFHLLKHGITDFTTHFPDLKSARCISDHVPVWAVFHWKNNN